MELDEAPALFLHNMGNDAISRLRRTVRLFLVSDSLDLADPIKRLLEAPEEQLIVETSLTDAETRLPQSGADIVIGDVSVSDAWDSSVFDKFDEWAASHPVIVLCPNARDAKQYSKNSTFAFDILPIDVVHDNRFICVIHAAMLRFEVHKEDEEASWGAASDFKGVRSGSW